ncbi:hypothetical protein KIM67_06605 [Flagellimonas sp. 389]|uniref:hypothetical protein n=1 Tax=Flagellimonas sp. 389 TaxID=2835862 RepID=UPI001BD64E30|nr:hypothetical protein [Flagellimonas sp. 389]MBS9462075.1 hypothetical protein [Flagellimonas sp. 389]
MRLFLLLPALFLVSCNSKNRVAFKEDCQSLNEKYLKLSSEHEIDSALYYLDRTINCDSESDFFKFEKVKYYVSLGQYQNAYNYLDVIILKNESSYLTYKGALGLKLNKPEAENLLRQAHTAYGKMSKKEIDKRSAATYKISLDNYFLGKQNAIEQITEYKSQPKKEEHEIQVIDFIENAINTLDKKEVLLTIFNIK